MKKVLIALLVLSACGTAVFAGEMQKEGGAMLGYAVPGGDLGDFLDSGVAFGLDYEGYKVNDMLSIGGGFIYTSGTGDFDVLGTTFGEYSVSTWGLTPYAKYSKEITLGANKATAYGLAGLGLYGVSTEIKYNANSILNGQTSSGSDSEVGLHLGGGIMFPLGDMMKIGADVRYHMVASNLSYFIPAAKFTYSF